MALTTGSEKGIEQHSKRNVYNRVGDKYHRTALIERVWKPVSRTMVALDKNNQVANLFDRHFLQIYLQKLGVPFWNRNGPSISHMQLSSEHKRKQHEKTLCLLGDWSEQQAWQHELNATKRAIICNLFHGVIH